MKGVSMEKRINEILMEKKYNFHVKCEQLSVIENILLGKDTFAVLPTGYGKSMCYILPPLLLQKVHCIYLKKT